VYFKVSFLFFWDSAVPSAAAVEIVEVAAAVGLEEGKRK